MLIAMLSQLTPMNSQSNNCIPEVNFPDGRVIMNFDRNRGDILLRFHLLWLYERLLA